MIAITPTIAIDESEIHESFVRASGPGGQNVNKVATAVQLRFDVHHSSLPPDVRDRLERLAGKRLSAHGILLIDSRQHRSQEQNRQDALNRLVDLIRQAAVQPKKRRRSKTTLAARLRRLEQKRRRSETKSLRKTVLKID